MVRLLAQLLQFHDTYIDINQAVPTSSFSGYINIPSLIAMPTHVPHASAHKPDRSNTVKTFMGYYRVGGRDYANGSCIRPSQTRRALQFNAKQPILCGVVYNNAVPSILSRPITIQPRRPRAHSQSQLLPLGVYALPKIRPLSLAVPNTIKNVAGGRRAPNTRAG